MVKQREAPIELVSFGFKYRQPPANYYFDISFIKNPARQVERGWGFFTEPDSEMRAFVLGQDATRQFIELALPMVSFLSAIDQHQVFGFGCNAGRHRSYIVVEEIARRLSEQNIPCVVRHLETNSGAQFVDGERTAL